MEKSRDAFRTISEVAGWLDVPTHVLRFWESRFSQIKPVKRAGGRRYYRPSDMSLIGGIKTLLHDQGMTIRGVQKMLREQGIKHVSSFSPPLHADDEPDNGDDVIEGTAVTLDPPKRPVSIPAPAARATRDAEPQRESGGTAGTDPEEDDQADMFPEPQAPDTDEVPMFAHRRTPDPIAEAPAEQPTPSIPDTPYVPATDPADDDPTRDVSESAGIILLRMKPAGIAARKDDLRPIADRMKRLRARMAE